MKHHGRVYAVCIDTATYHESSSQLMFLVRDPASLAPAMVLEGPISGNWRNSPMECSMFRVMYGTGW